MEDNSTKNLNNKDVQNLGGNTPKPAVPPQQNVAGQISAANATANTGVNVSNATIAKPASGVGTTQAAVQQVAVNGAPKPTVQSAPNTTPVNVVPVAATNVVKPVAAQANIAKPAVGANGTVAQQPQPVQPGVSNKTNDQTNVNPVNNGVNISASSNHTNTSNPQVGINNAQSKMQTGLNQQSATAQPSVNQQPVGQNAEPTQVATSTISTQAPSGKSLNQNIDSKQSIDSSVYTKKDQSAQSNSFLSENEKKVDSKKRKRGKAVWIAFLILLVAAVGIVVAVYAFQNRRYSISFDAGPWGDIQPVVVKIDEVYEIPDSLDPIKDSNGRVVCEFKYWANEDGSRYEPTKVSGNIKLFAKYESKEVESVFVAKNNYYDSGYVYLTTLKTKFYDDKIDFGDEDLLQSIANLNTGDYATLGYMRSYNISTGVKTETNLSTTDYARFVDTYYGLKGYTTNMFSDEVEMSLEDSILTPKDKKVYCVVYNPNEIEINLHSNLSSVKDYYLELDDGFDENNYQDQTISFSETFKKDYTLLNYISYTSSNGFTLSNPDYHNFLGWSVVQPTDEIIQSGDYYRFDQVINLDRRTLNNLNTIDLYGVWKVADANLVIVTDYNEKEHLFYQETKMSMGSTKSIEELSVKFNLQKDGYALVGFNAKADGTGEIVELDGSIVGKRNVSYYDSATDRLVLYAVYKKVVDQVVFEIADSILDPATYGDYVTDSFEYDLNFTEWQNEKEEVLTYYYDTNLITVEYDQTSNAIIIYNLIEGAEINLPQLSRDNYSIFYYKLNGRNVLMTSTYVCSSADFVVDTSNIVFTPNWVGVQYEFKIYEDDTKTTYKRVYFNYGDEIYFLTDSVLEGITTKLIIKFYNAASGVEIMGANCTINKVGNSFIGCFNDDAQQIEAGVDSAFVVNSEFNQVYCDWEPSTYSVTYYLNGGLYNGSADAYIDSGYEYNSVATLLTESDVERDGYWFKGWALNVEDSNSEIVTDQVEIVIEGNVEVYAVWYGKKYVELFDDKNKTQSVLVEVSKDNKFSLTGEEFAGTKFSKYNTSAYGDGEMFVCSESPFEFTADENLEMYAMWLNVEFDKNDDLNTYAVGTAPETFSVTYGAVFELPEGEFVCFDYYSFGGWKYDGQENINSFAITSENGFEKNQDLIDTSIVFEAIWNYKNVRINVYENSNKKTLTYSEVVDVNNKEFIELSSGLNQIPSRIEGKVDYLTDGEIAYIVDNSGLHGVAQIEIKKPSSEILNKGLYTYDAAKGEFIYSVYAVWDLTVTFDANNFSAEKTLCYVGVEKNDANGDGVYQIDEIGSTYNVKLIENPFVNDNKTFVAWGDRADATRGLAAGSDVEIFGNTTYYAIWQNSTFKAVFKNIWDDNAKDYIDKEVDVEYSSSIVPADALSIDVDTIYENASDVYKNLVSFRYDGNDFAINSNIQFLCNKDLGFILDNEFEDGKIVFEGIWEEKTYTINVDLDGAIYTGSITDLNSRNILYVHDDTLGRHVLQYNVKYSEVRDTADGIVLISSDMAKPSHRFDGFVLDLNNTVTNLGIVYIYNYTGTSHDFENNVENDIKVKWQEFFTLAYDANGGISQIDSTVSDVIDDKAIFTLETNPNKIAFDNADGIAGFWYSKDVSTLPDIDQVIAGLVNSDEIFGFGQTIEVSREIMNQYGKNNQITLYAIWYTTVVFANDSDIEVKAYVTPEEQVDSDVNEFIAQFYIGAVLDSTQLQEYKFVSKAEAFKFDGWKLSSTPITQLNISGPVTIYAVWVNSHINIYLKNYDGSDFATPVVFREVFDPSLGLNLTSMFDATGNARPELFGHSFIGWKVGPSDTIVTEEKSLFVNVFIDNINKFYMPSDSVTLYAVMTIEKVNIIYNKNNENAGGVEKVALVNYGANYNIEEAVYDLDYFEIVGWSLTAEDTQNLIYVNDILQIDQASGVEYDGGSGKYNLNLYAQWQRKYNNLTINFGDGYFENTGYQAEPIAEFYTEGTAIKSAKFNGNTIELEVYQGNTADGYGFVLPGVEYVQNNNRKEIDSYVSISSETYEIGVCYGMTSNLILNAVWTQLVRINVFKNLLDDGAYVSLDAKLDSNVVFAKVDGDFYINDTLLNFADERFILMSYTKTTENEGQTINPINTTRVLNSQNFSIDMDYNVNLYCQWEGVDITVVINYNDAQQTQNQTRRTINTKFAKQIDLTEYIPTHRADGNIGYSFDKFVYEYVDGSNIRVEYNSENGYIFDSLLVDFKVGEPYEINVGWKRALFSLSYVLDYSTFTGTYRGVEYVDASLIETSFEYGERIVLLDKGSLNYPLNNPNYPLYKFDCFKSNVEINGLMQHEQAFNMPTCNVILSDSWTNNEVRVVLNAGEDAEFNDGKTQKIIAGLKVEDTILIDGDNVPTRTGYTFEYVRVVETGEGQEELSYLQGVDFEIDFDGVVEAELENMWNSASSSFDIVLTARWTANTYTVVYNSNVPTIEKGYAVNATSSPSGSVISSNFVYDQEKDLNEEGYILVGWTQLGWNTQEDGLGVNYLFADDGCKNALNLIDVNNAVVELYAIWKQNEYVIRFVDETGANAEVSKNVLFDATYNINVDIMNNRESEELYFDSVNGYYIKFNKWQYVYQTQTGKEYENDEDITISLLSNGGFLFADNVLTSNEILFKAVWEEVDYNLYLRLNGGSYLQTSDSFEYIYDAALSDFAIVAKVKYSQIREGFDLTTIGFDRDYIESEFEFAGWSLDKQNTELDFAEDIIKISDLEQDDLNPASTKFEVFANWCNVIVTIDANGGRVIVESPDVLSEISSNGYNVSNDGLSIFTYTYKNSEIELPLQINTWFVKENYHVDETNSILTKTNGVISVATENVTDFMVWTGNYRQIILNVTAIEASIVNSGSLITNNVGYTIVNIAEEDFVADKYYVYGYDAQNDIGAFELASSYVENEVYYELSQTAVTIESKFGDEVDLSDIVAQAEDEKFTGWVDESGNNNYSTKTVIVLCGDNNVIILHDTWNENKLFFELNGGYCLDEDEIERNYITPKNIKEDANGYYYDLPKIDNQLRKLGPFKTGYKFLGWSDTCQTYDVYVQNGMTDVLYNNDTTDSVKYRIVEAQSATLYAIWKPLEIKFIFSSAEITNTSITHGPEIIKMVEYGEVFNVVSASEVVDWLRAGHKIDGLICKENNKNYALGDLFNVNVYGDLTEDVVRNSPYEVHFYTNWTPINISIKIYLNEGSYIGNNAVYKSKISSDSDGMFILIEDIVFGTNFTLISFEDFYLFGYYASSYYNLVRGSSISASNTSININSEYVKDNLVKLRVDYSQATAYIKDYYKINTHKFYAEFEDAIKDLRENDEIVLITDKVLISQVVEINKNTTISVDPNFELTEITRKIGFAETEKPEYVFIVTNGKTLKIKGDKTNQRTLLFNGAFGAETYRMFGVFGATLDIEGNVSVSNNKNSLSAHGGAIYVQNGTFKADGAIFASNSVDTRLRETGLPVYGGAIYATNSTVELANCRFEINSAICDSASSGGAIYISGGILNINSCVFSRNTCSSSVQDTVCYGGAIAIESCTSVNIVGTEESVTYFEHNAATLGGAIYITGAQPTEFNVAYTNFADGNSQVADLNSVKGGAIYICASINNIEISNSKLYSNNAGNGGAIYAEGQVKINQSELFDNIATMNGGAIYAINYCEIVDCIIGAENAANKAQKGAGVYTVNNLKVCSSDSGIATFISYNETYENGLGAAIYAEGISSEINIDIDYAQFENNLAYNGAAIYVVNYANVTIDESVFNNNIAGNNGGAIFFNSATNSLQTSNNEFNLNTALNGGALYISADEAIMTGDSIVDSSATLGGGISANNTTLNLIDVVIRNSNDLVDDDNSCLGGALYVSADSVVNINGGEYHTNKASCGAVVYNLGVTNITNITVSGNDLDKSNQIYNAGTMCLYGENSISTSVKLYLEKAQTPNTYHYINVGNDFVNINEEENYIIVIVEEYFLGADIVVFNTDDAYKSYKAELEESETGTYIFTILNTDEYRLEPIDESKTLRIDCQNYKINFVDISADKVDVPVDSEEVEYGYAFSVDFVNKFATEGYIPSRTGYEFVAWAYVNGPQIGVETTDIDKEIYEDLELGLGTYAKIEDLPNINFVVSNYNIYFYAVWMPYEFNIIYTYDNSGYSINGVAIDDNNIEDLYQTAEYNGSLTLRGESDLYSVEFVNFFDGQITFDGSKPVKVDENIVSYDEVKKVYYFIYNASIRYEFDGSRFVHILEDEYTLINDVPGTEYLCPQKIRIGANELDVEVKNGRYTFNYNGLDYVYIQNYRPDNYKFVTYLINGFRYSLGETVIINKENIAGLIVEEKTLNVTICFERMVSTVEINSNGGEENIVFNLAVGESFDLPVYNNTTNYAGKDYFIYKANFALKGFSEDSMGTKPIEKTSVVVPETANGYYRIFAIWSEADCYVKDVVQKDSRKYNIYYETIEQAFEDVNKDGLSQEDVYPTSGATNYTVVIIKNIEVKETIEILCPVSIEADKSVIITVESGLISANNAFVINAQTKIGRKASGTIEFVGDNTTIDGNSLILVNNNLELDSTVLFKNFKATNGGAIYVAQGSLSIKGCEFILNEAINGGAIYVAQGANVNIDSTIFGGKDNKNSAINGGAIYVAGNINFVKATFYYNEAENGGAIYFDAESTCNNLNDVVFSENIAENGGAIYTKAHLNIGDSEKLDKTPKFNSNTAVNGGTIYIDKTTLNINTVLIQNNKATNGAGIYLVESTLNIAGGKFEGNEASDNGGVIYATTDNIAALAININSESTIFRGNEASDNGGAIYAVYTLGTAVSSLGVPSVYILNITDAKFNDNVSANGAALYLSNVTAILNSGVEFVNNGLIEGDVKTINGGAVVATRGAYLKTSSLFKENKSFKGGAIYSEGASYVELTSLARLEANKALDYGGGLYVGGSSKVNCAAEIISNEANYGGAAYFNTTNTDSSELSGKMHDNIAIEAESQTDAVSGSAIHIIFGKVECNGIEISNNKNKNENGTAVYVDIANSIFNLIDGQIKNNIVETVEGEPLYCDVYVCASQQDIDGKFILGANAYVNNITLDEYTRINVSAKLTTSEKFVITFVDPQEDTVVVEFANESDVSEDHFVLVDTTYYLSREARLLKLFRKSNIVAIDPNGGIHYYDGQEYSVPFAVNIDGYNGKLFNSIELLTQITGYKFGYSFDLTFEGSDSKLYSVKADNPYIDNELCDESIIPSYPLSLSAVWNDVTINAWTLVEDDKQIGEYLEQNYINSITMNKGVDLGKAQKTYNTFVDWVVAYRSDMEIIKTNIRVDGSTKFNLDMLNSDDLVSGGSYSYKDIYNRIIENKEIYFVACFERNKVEITIYGNGGLHISEENKTIVEAYQDEEYFELFVYKDQFIRDGHILSSMFITNGKTEVDYSLDDRIDIRDKETLELYCRWQVAEAYIKAFGTNPDRYYTRFVTAVEEAVDGETVVILTNITLLNTVFVDKKITITSANVYSILRAETFVNGYMFEVSKDVVFGENGPGAEKTLTISGNDVSSSKGGILLKEGTLTLNTSAVITQHNTQNGAIYVEGGVLFVEGSTLTNNKAKNGGAIYALAGTLLFNNILIDGNTAVNGGGIYVGGSATITMTIDCVISNNIAQKGAGIYYASNQQNIIEAGDIKFNNLNNAQIDSNYQGGGIFVAKNSQKLTLGSVKITENYSYYGGGVFVEGVDISRSDNEILVINGSEIKTNKAECGSAVCVSDGKTNYSYHVVTVVDCEIENNTFLTTYSNKAAALAVFNGKLEFNGGNIRDNDLNIYVSAVSASSYGTVCVRGGLIKNEGKDSIYVKQHAKLIVSSYVQIFDFVVLEKNAYIYVDANISDISPVIMIKPTVYPAADESIKVVEFKDGIKYDYAKFDINDEDKDDYRLKADGKIIYLTEAKFLLTFNGNGGKAELSMAGAKNENNNASIEVKYNQRINEIVESVVATFANKNLEDWSTVPAGIGENIDLGVDVLMPYADWTLYAVWSGTYFELTIIFNDDVGSTTATYDGEEVEDGRISTNVFVDTPGETSHGQVALTSVSSKLARVGYTLKGYALLATATKADYEPDGKNFNMPEGDTILYVMWDANQYSIVYDPNIPAKTESIIEENIPDTVAKFDNRFVLSTGFILKGYTQVSWNTAKDGTGDTYAVGASINTNLAVEAGTQIKLYAIWNPNEYKVEYDLNIPGSATSKIYGSIGPTTHVYDVASNISDTVLKLTGWTHVAWSANSDGIGDRYEIGEEVINLTDSGSITLYAVWRVNKYTIEYSYKDYDGSQLIKRVDNCEYDQYITLETVESKIKYANFEKWILGSKTYKAGEQVRNLTDVNNGVVKFDAQYKNFEATVYANNGEKIDPVVIACDNDAVIRLDASKFTSFVNIGYEIGEFNTNPDVADRTAIYNLNASYAIYGDIDLYVAWKAIVYTISFEKYFDMPNDIKGTLPESIQAWAYKEASNCYAEGSYTNVINMPMGSGLLLPGYTLVGWSYKPQEGVRDYELGQTITLTQEELAKIAEKQDISSGTIKLYTMWSNGYVVYYHLNTDYNVIARQKNNWNAISNESTKEFNTGILPVSIEDYVIGDKIGKNNINWEISDESNNKYAYFAGWAEETDKTVIKYVNGDIIEGGFVTEKHLYAVWTEYTNPNYFEYNADTIVDFSSKGKEEIVDKEIDNIVLPAKNYNNGVDIEKIAAFSISGAASAITTIDFVCANKVATIDNDAFVNFIELKKVLNINSHNLTYLGYGAFAVKTLNEVDFIDDDGKYIVDKNYNVYKQDGSYKKLHTYLIKNSLDDPFELGYSVNEIFEKAFYKTEFTQLDITDLTGVNAIGFNAFAQMSKLNTLKVPFVGNAKDGDKAFIAYNFGLETNTTGNTVGANPLPASLETIVVINGDIAQGAFRNCSTLKNITYNNAGSIGDYAFFNCTSLQSVNLKGEPGFDISSAKSIGDYAFNKCNKLAATQLVFEEVEIGTMAFAETNISSVKFDKASNVTNNAFYNTTTLTTAWVYKMAQFEAVVNNTGITNDPVNGTIYTDANFYLYLMLERQELLTYHIVVEDMFDILGVGDKKHASSLEEAIEIASNSSYASAQKTIIVKISQQISKCYELPHKTTLIGALNDYSGDVDLTSVISQHYGENIVVELTRVSDYKGIMFKVAETKTVTFGGAATSGYSQATLVIDGNNIDVEENSAVLVESNATLNLNENLIIKNCKADIGAAVKSYGHININGAILTNNKAENGGAIYINNGVLTIDSGVIRENTATVNGGAIYVDNGASVVIIDGIIEGNETTGGNGGAIYVNGGTLSVVAGTIRGNEATGGNGGAIYACASASLVIKGGTITQNKAASYGGAISAVNSSVSINGENVEISENAAEIGGAICAQSGSVTVSSGKIIKNKANSCGGAIYISATAELIIEGGELLSNSAQNGGAIYVNAGNAIISGGYIGSNTATNGGAIYTAGGTTAISGGSITSNIATNNGGAVYVNDGSATISGGSITSNTATENGGAIYTAGGTTTISGGTVSGNTAKQGGELYVSAETTISGCQITSNTTEKRNLIFVAKSNLKISGGTIGSVAERDALSTPHTIAGIDYNLDAKIYICDAAQINTDIMCYDTDADNIVIKDPYSGASQLAVLFDSSINFETLNTDVYVARFVEGVNAETSKFICPTNGGITFIKNSQNIFARAAQVRNNTQKTLHGTLEDAVAKADANNVIEILKAIEVNSTIAIDKTLKIIISNQAAQQKATPVEVTSTVT